MFSLSAFKTLNIEKNLYDKLLKHVLITSQQNKHP